MINVKTSQGNITIKFFLTVTLDNIDRAILAYLFYRATPESYGSENMRVVRFQNKHERRAAIEGVSLLAVSFLVIGIMGDFSNLWGWVGCIDHCSKAEPCRKGYCPAPAPKVGEVAHYAYHKE